MRPPKISGGSKVKTAAPFHSVAAGSSNENRFSLCGRTKLTLRSVSASLNSRYSAPSPATRPPTTATSTSWFHFTEPPTGNGILALSSTLRTCLAVPSIW